MLSEATIATLKTSFRGAVVEPGDARYDAARKVYNAMIDRRPRLIARCADVADVITAVNFARENKVLLAVRGGGHNAAGLGVCDDGLVIDLSRMQVRPRGPEEADGARRRRRALGRRRSRDARLRPGRAGRHHLDHRRRRPDPRRRHRSSDAPMRPDHRQPAGGRHGAGRRPLRDGQRRRRMPISSGPCAAAAATSASSRRSCSRRTRSTPTTPGRCSGTWRTPPR